MCITQSNSLPTEMTIILLEHVQGSKNASPYIIYNEKTHQSLWRTKALPTDSSIFRLLNHAVSLFQSVFLT